MTHIHRLALLMTVVLVLAPATPVVGYSGSGATHELSPATASADAAFSSALTAGDSAGGDAASSATESAWPTNSSHDSALANGLPAVGSDVFDADALRSPSPLRVSDRPLSFVENRGQFADDIGYVVDGSGRRVSFTTDGVVFAARDGNPVTMRFVDGDGARIDGLSRASGVVNYYRGSDPEGWHTAVPTYEGVAYRDLAPGVDLVFGGTDGVLKSEFVLDPGVSHEVVRVRYDGSASVSVDASGALVVETGGAPLVEAPPVAYQTVDGEQVSVPVSYVVTDGVVSFDVGAYDETRPLVIDPVFDYSVPAFSTLLGSTNNEESFDVHLGDDGTVTIVGFTFEDDIPVRTPTVQDSVAGDIGADTFVVQYDRFGKLIYGTYLGGTRGDIGFAVGVDDAGAVYVGGATDSTDFPTAGAAAANLKTTRTDTADGNPTVDSFVTKIAPNGTALVYSGYIGGSSTDELLDIDVEGDGTLHFVGQTFSPDLSTTANAYAGAIAGADSEFGFSGDGFYGRINSSNVRDYLTYYGGSETDSLKGVAAGPDGVALAGYSQSLDFPVTANALQPTPAPAQFIFDAVVVQFDDAGQPTYSSYVGGDGQDQGEAVAVDDTGRVYLTGITGSSNLPTKNASEPLESGSFDAFLSAFDLGGTQPTLRHSTYLGGAEFDWGTGVAVVENGTVVVVGEATRNFTTTNAFQPAFGGDGFGGTFSGRRVFYDGFYTTIDTTRSGPDSRLASSYLGGTGGDRANGVAANAAGRIAVTGFTFSADYPVVVNDIATPESVYAGNADAFVTVLEPTICRTDPNDNNNPDDDGDGLCDEWELNGVDIDGDGTVDLPIHEAPYNANMSRKDLFVEIDYMDCAVGASAGACQGTDAPRGISNTAYATHNHDPRAGLASDSLPAVVAAFAAAPVDNPDGSTGITIHPMVDEAMPEVTPIRFDEDNTSTTTQFSELKWGPQGTTCEGYFGTAAERASANCEAIRDARHQVFRYAIMGHQRANSDGTISSSSGIADLPGDDFLVTLPPSWQVSSRQTAELWNQNPTAADYREEYSTIVAGTFVHELGHTLSLRHGGGDHKNHKPNYLSVMSYSFQFDSTGRASVVALPAFFNETFLVENTATGRTYNASSYSINRTAQSIEVTEQTSSGTASSVITFDPLTDASGNAIAGLYVPTSDAPLVIYHRTGRPLDYSSVALAPLDERALDELQGVGSAPNRTYTLFDPDDTTDYFYRSDEAFSLAPGTEKVVNVTFNPFSAGMKRAYLEIESNDPIEQTRLVRLVGEDAAGRDPNGDLVVSPGSLLFDNVTPGQTATGTVVIENTGDDALEVTNVFLTGGGAPLFDVSGVTTPFTLPAGDSRTATVDFNATRGGDFQADLVVRAADSDQPSYVVDLAGTNRSISFADLVTEPTRLDFGPVPVRNGSTLPLTIRNAGDAQLNVTDVTLVDKQGASLGTVGTPIDWDENGVVTTPVTRSIDDGRGVNTLVSWDDWSQIVYTARNTRDFAPGSSVTGPQLFEEYGGEPDIEEYRERSLPSLDIDGDGVDNAVDVCFTEFDPRQSDADGDGIGDTCELSTPFSSPGTLDVGQTGTFSVPSPEPRFDYVWSLGDGTTATGVSASHTYDTPGVYTVSLEVLVGGLVVADREQQVLSVTGVGAPTLDASIETTANSVGAPVRVAANPTGLGENVTRLTLERTDGTVLDIATCDTAACNATLSYVPTTSTWTGAAYGPESLVVNTTTESGQSTTVVVETAIAIAGDANADGIVNVQDAALVGVAFGSSAGDGTYTDAADLNNDGRVDPDDVAILRDTWRDEAAVA
ncbi:MULTISPECIES: choice-of-anchor D domain-containing protein [Salinibaculum]|uniref:DUF7948 domain-containing protein n=1 Tax=Salinibaculum TaxID=2732368 RepID=UPI0030CC66D1